MDRDYSGYVTFQYMGTKYKLKVESILGHSLSKHMLPKKVIDTSSMIVAPMPGLVKSITATVGQRVRCYVSPVLINLSCFSPG